MPDVICSYCLSVLSFVDYFGMYFTHVFCAVSVGDDSAFVLTYLHSPWSRVLLEKLTGSAASQEIPHIFGTRRFLTVLTSARHLSLS